MDSGLWGNLFKREQFDGSTPIRYVENCYSADPKHVSDDVIVVKSRLACPQTFILPSEAYLLVELQLTKENGESYGEDDHIRLSNCWSLFKKAELMYNGVVMDTVDEPGTVSHIKSVMSGCDVGQTEHCHANKKNWAALKLSDVFDVCGVHKPLRSITLELRLTREHEYNKILFRDLSTAPGKVVIHKVDLYMPSLTPHIQVFAEINKKLQSKTPIPLDFQHFWCKNYDVKVSQESGKANVSQVIRCDIQRPQYILVAFRSADRFKVQTKNHLIFDNPKTISGYAKLNMQRYPAIEYDSTSHGFFRMYNAFRKLAPESTITLEQWMNTHSFYCFDLSNRDTGFDSVTDHQLELNFQLDYPKNMIMTVIVVGNDYCEIVEGRNNISTISKPSSSNLVCF